MGFHGSFHFLYAHSCSSFAHLTSHTSHLPLPLTSYRIPVLSRPPLRSQLSQLPFWLRPGRGRGRILLFERRILTRHALSLFRCALRIRTRPRPASTSARWRCDHDERRCGCYASDDHRPARFFLCIRHHATETGPTAVRFAISDGRVTLLFCRSLRTRFRRWRSRTSPLTSILRPRSPLPRPSRPERLEKRCGRGCGRPVRRARKRLLGKLPGQGFPVRFRIRPELARRDALVRGSGKGRRVGVEFAWW